jgi:hypothetical protein
MFASAHRLDDLLSDPKFRERETPKTFIVWTFASPKMFHAFKSMKSFYRYMLSLEPKKRNFCETIREGPQKPRFDLDIKPEDLPLMRTPEDVINELCYAITRLCEEITTNNIYIFSSIAPNGEKYSYHVVVDNWRHNNSFEAKCFYDRVIAEMPRDMADFVDHSVYKSVQQFRMLGNTKVDDYRPKIRVTHWDYLRELTLMGQDKQGYEEFAASLVTCVKHCQALPVEATKKWDNDDAEIHYPGLEHLERLVPSEYQLDLKSGLKSYGYRLQRREGIGKKECIVCHRTHGTNTKGDNARIFMKGNKVFFACFRDATKTHYLLDTIDQGTVTLRSVLEDGTDDLIPADDMPARGTRQGPVIKSSDLVELMNQARNNGARTTTPASQNVVNQMALLREGRKLLSESV